MIRIGDPTKQTAAYMAGIYGNAPTSALPVVVNASGQLGTTTAGIGVTSFNGRSGAVVPAANDYSFSLLSGSLGGSQLTGSYTSPVTLSNTSNSFTGSFTGNGTGLTGVLPAAASPNYIQNGTTQQSSSNFNISGTGTANNFAAVTSYQIAGSGGVLSIGNPANFSLFVGVGAGANNSGTYNTFSGWNAGHSNGTGAYNTFSGYSAGYTNSGGNFNTFTGYLAGYSSDCPSYNTFTGYQAGYSNGGCYYSWGDFNTFTGAQAGLKNNTGNSNTFSGYQTGYSNLDGVSNAFYGTQAGYSTNDGSSNTFTATNPATPTLSVATTPSWALGLATITPQATATSTSGIKVPFRLGKQHHPHWNAG